MYNSSEAAFSFFSHSLSSQIWFLSLQLLSLLSPFIPPSIFFFSPFERQTPALNHPYHACILSWSLHVMPVHFFLDSFLLSNSSSSSRAIIFLYLHFSSLMDSHSFLLSFYSLSIIKTSLCCCLIHLKRSRVSVCVSVCLTPAVREKRDESQREQLHWFGIIEKKAGEKERESECESGELWVTSWLTWLIVSLTLTRLFLLFLTRKDVKS